MTVIAIGLTCYKLSCVATMGLYLLVYSSSAIPAQAEEGRAYLLRAESPIRLARGTKPKGKIMFAARVDRLEDKGATSLIRYKGWYQKGAARVVYALPGKRIIDLILKKSATSGLEELSRWTDPDTEIEWVEASFKAWVKTSLLETDAEILWGEAGDLFAENCTKCHQRRIPHHYTVNQWGSHIKVMGPRTGLPKSEQRKILKYLQYRAKDIEH